MRDESAYFGPSWNGRRHPTIDNLLAVFELSFKFCLALSVVVVVDRRLTGETDEWRSVGVSLLERRAGCGGDGRCRRRVRTLRLAGCGGGITRRAAIVAYNGKKRERDGMIIMSVPAHWTFCTTSSPLGARLGPFFHLIVVLVILVVVANVLYKKEKKKKKGDGPGGIDRQGERRADGRSRERRNKSEEETRLGTSERERVPRYISSLPGPADRYRLKT